MYGVLSDVPNCGLTTFFISCTAFPGGAVVIVACVLNGWAGDRFGNRTLFACVPMTSALIGMIIVIALPITHDSNIGRLIGFYMTQAIPATGATVLSLVSSHVAGYTKKSTVAAFNPVGYCVGNIIGPYTFTLKAAPHYASAEITIIICYALCIVDLLFINWWYRRLNGQKAAVRASIDYLHMESQAWRDLTDRENPELIYTLQPLNVYLSAKK
ncbi:MAG: hypothetical protein FE78DRAFT_79547 [Acidomyces sp. 'richmondensis']|nr:MAG: hypothetical protein FE78DRAFT_79547 [Acidomyces sp. 'richmondensis']